MLVGRKHIHIHVCMYVHVCYLVMVLTIRGLGRGELGTILINGIFLHKAAALGRELPLHMSAQVFTIAPSNDSFLIIYNVAIATSSFFFIYNFFVLLSLSTSSMKPLKKIRE